MLARYSAGDRLRPGIARDPLLSGQLRHRGRRGSLDMHATAQSETPEAPPPTFLVERKQGPGEATECGRITVGRSGPG